MNPLQFLRLLFKGPTPQQMAAQLRKPHGFMARKVGERMNAANRELYHGAWKALDLRADMRVLEIGFDSGEVFRLPFELLRVYSPSAEVQGHGPGQEVLQTGKREVDITALAPVGNYAVQPSFSDGHDSGIFTWEYLYHLGAEQAALWRQYEQRLRDAGVERDAPMPGKAGSACGHH